MAYAQSYTFCKGYRSVTVLPGMHIKVPLFCFLYIYIYNIYLYLPWAHCDLLLGIPGIQRSATYVCKFQPGQCLTNSHLSGHIRLTLRTYWPPASLALAMIPMINEPTSHLDTMNLSTKTSMDHPSSALSDGGLKISFSWQKPILSASCAAGAKLVLRG